MEQYFVELFANSPKHIIEGFIDELKNFEDKSIKLITSKFLFLGIEAAQEKLKSLN